MSTRPVFPALLLRRPDRGASNRLAGARTATCARTPRSAMIGRAALGWLLVAALVAVAPAASAHHTGGSSPAPPTSPSSSDPREA